MPTCLLKCNYQVTRRRSCFLPFCKFFIIFCKIFTQNRESSLKEKEYIGYTHSKYSKQSIQWSLSKGKIKEIKRDSTCFDGDGKKKQNRQEKFKFMWLKAKGNGKRYIHWIINIRFYVKKMLFVHFSPILLPKNNVLKTTASRSVKRDQRRSWKKKQGERRTQ